MPRVAPHYAQVVKIGEHRVERSYLTFMAALLQQHGLRKRILRDLEEQVIRATPAEGNQGMPRASGVSNPTHAAMERLDDDREPTFRARGRLRATIRTIEEVYTILSPDQQTIIDGLYLRKDKTLVGVALAINKSQATVCRWRNEALLTFALNLIGDEILLPPPVR